MTPRPFEFRFGVGKPDFSHSMVWKVWSGRKTADLYITARPIGGAVKVSFVWLEPAPEGQVLEVQLLYAPPEAQVQTRLPSDGSAQVICLGRFDRLPSSSASQRRLSRYDLRKPNQKIRRDSRTVLAH
jgi:hypothetical protein